MLSNMARALLMVVSIFVTIHVPILLQYPCVHTGVVWFSLLVSFSIPYVIIVLMSLTHFTYTRTLLAQSSTTYYVY